MNNERSLAKEITEGFEALKSMRNNEPVAWMYESKNVDGKPYISDVSLKPLFGLVTRYGYREIPLYTHPVKELTDEEITQVFDECYPNNADGDVVTLIDFARAILRKAQR